MRIGELAQRAGTTTRTLRYYESRGLLPARRAVNGYRAYGEEDLRLLRQIRLLQDFGFELEETRPFVDCLRAGHPSGDSCPASLEVYRRKLAEIDECVERLQAVREQVRGQLLRAQVEASAEHPGEPLCEAKPSEWVEGTEMTTSTDVVKVTDETFASEVLGSEFPVLVDFTADWCPPCRMLAPVLADVAREQQGRLKVVTVDVDVNPATQAAYGVLSMPTLMVFQGGEPVKSLVGARPKRRLLQELEEWCAD